jgi:hypothetical protein
VTVPVVVPTHLRAGDVHAMKAVRPVILCVAESQVPAYQEAYPMQELLVHPDKIRGISPKRQWIYEQMGDVFMLDDDCTELRKLHDPVAKTTRVEPEEAFDVIQNTADMARDLGAYLWGLANNAIGRNYSAFHPFRTTGYVNAAFMGLFRDPRGKLHFPDDPYCVAEDYYISGLNAYYYRYTWADDRFGFHQLQTFHHVGGLAEFRNLGHEEAWMKELKRLFGDNIIVEKHMRTSHGSEKILKVPWATGVR